MINDLTELVFILDKSGSMHGLEADTIGGFNSLIEKQKKEDGKALVTTILFDDKSEMIHDRVDLQYIRSMTNEQYVTGGTTALLDAVGGAVNHIRKIHKYIRPEDVPAKTLFIITTDGMENASRRYTYDRVKKLIETGNCAELCCSQRGHFRSPLRRGDRLRLEQLDKRRHEAQKALKKR